MAIKKGFTLFWGRCDGTCYVKQAKSVRQFMFLCMLEEERKGYRVPPKGRWLYRPDLWYDEGRKVWREVDGGAVYGPKLPKEVRR